MGVSDGAAVSDGEGVRDEPVLRAEDALEIHGLLAEYGLAADECRFEDWARLFTPDGEMCSPSRTVRGFDALLRFISSSQEGLHLSGLPRVEVSADRATATTPFLFVTHEGQVRRGIYEDTLRHTGEGWRIERRRGRLLHSGRL